MTLEEARGLAAQAWCTEVNQHKVMDVDLACAFADILHREVARVAFPYEMPKCDKPLVVRSHPLDKMRVTCGADR